MLKIGILNLMIFLEKGCVPEDDRLAFGGDPDFKTNPKILF